jgi:hypothetical protein
MMSDKRIAFVLAGSSGSGKSTLLQKAFKQKIPLFGGELNELFQAVNPLCLPEKHNFKKALDDRAVFQAKHIPKLLALSDPPKHLVFHLDILNVLVRLINHPVFMEDMPMGLKVMQPREPEDLVDKETNKRMFRHYLDISFPGIDLVLVNTLYTPYLKNVEQWQTKATEHSSVDLEHPLFDVNNPRPDIHEAVYEAWIETVEKLNCHAHYVSTIENGVLEINERGADAKCIHKAAIV